MSKRPPLFKVLDTFLFKQVDRYSSSQAHQKVVDLLAPLSEPAQKIVNHALTLVLIALPVLITMTMMISNYELSDNNDKLKETLELVDDIKQGKREVTAISSQVISNGTLANEADLAKRLRGINSKESKVQVISFDSAEAGSLTQVISNLKFDKLTLQELRNMLETLQVRERVKINRLRINRDNTTKRLAGEIEISHFSKVANSQDPEDAS